MVAFLEEQAAAAQEMSRSTGSAEQAMWGVLRLLASHNGSLRAAGRPLKGKADDALGVWLACKHACRVDSFLLLAFSLHASWNAGSTEARPQGATPFPVQLFALQTPWSPPLLLCIRFTRCCESLVQWRALRLWSAEAELAAVLAPPGGGGATLMPAWQAPGYAAAALQGNGGAPSAAHPGAAEHVQRLLLEGKKAEALRC